MVIPLPQDRGEGSSFRNMPVFSARSSQLTRSSFENRNMTQTRGGSVSDARYSPTSPYRTSPGLGSPKSPQSAGSPGLGPTPTYSPRGILRSSSGSGVTRRLSRGVVGGSTPHYIPSPSTEVSTFPESIERAARITESVYSKDSQFPSLFMALIGRDESGGLYPVSGSVEHDYPSVMERGLLSSRLFTVAHQTQIPSELKELLNQTEGATCHMGLFPELSRAWMSIGSDLYLWDFRDGSDLSFYDGLKESIIGLALIPTKANVFKSNLRHILCITTPSEIVILGFIISHDESTLGLATPSKMTMEVISQPIYTLSSDNILFPVVVGSSNGRIFIGGADGYIYEVYYQAQRGWLRDKCWKQNLTKSLVSKYLPKFLSLTTTDPLRDIVIDNQRKILFSLSLGGTIEAFDLGSDGSSFSSIGSMSQDMIINSVIATSKRSLEPIAVQNIISIAPIEHGELNFVAVADSGTRLYFTCLSNPSIGMTSSTRPCTLKLAHIRLPPGYSPMSNMRKPTGANVAYYSNGIFTISASAGSDRSALWLITPFIYPTVNYSELSTLHMVPGTTVDIKEIAIREVDSVVFEQPEVMSQHLPYRREIVVLTSHGTTVFKASKPYELLRDLLLERLGPENIKGHFDMIANRVQPLANCVLLAAHPFMFADNNIHDLATKCLYMYGGGTEVSLRSVQKPQQHVAFDLRQTPGFYEKTGMGDVSRNLTPNFEYETPWATPSSGGMQSPLSPVGPPTLSSTFRQDFSPASLGGSDGRALGNQQEGDAWPYSPKHDAIYTNVGRILASFWNMKLLRMGIIEGTKTNMIMPNISGEQVSYAIHFLQSLHNFILNNPSLYMTSYKVELNPAQMEGTPEARRLMCYELEKISMAALKNLLSYSLEVLGMWKILCDHQINIILQGVDERLMNTTLRDLIVAGQNTIPVIINALINKYLGDNAAVDTISIRLREVCPTLFRNEDAIGSKVAEILTKAKQTTNESEKITMLRDSLILCEQICGHGCVNIRNFCMQFAELGFPLGAIKLCESAAQAVDPNQLALTTLKSTSGGDPAANQAYNNRCEIYKIVLDMLDMYYNASNRQSPLAGRPSDESLPSEKAKFYADETFRGILESKDETFHCMLYNWLLEKNLFERLLDIKHHFLDTFLQRAAETVVSGKWPRGGTSDTKILDLLWRHHEMNGNHLAAAQILNRLADSTTAGLNFQDRLEYLARANICTKGIGRRGPGDDLETLEAKLEVAQIQKSILDVLETRINNLSGATGPAFDHTLSNELKMIQDGIQKLNAQLLSITALYQDFADPFKLHEVKLAIFCSAGHGDKSLIESFYADIIEAELSGSSRESMESQLELIRRRIVTLGKKYFPSPTFFPLEYLVEHLEAMKPTEKVDEAWVVKIMTEIGAPFQELLLIYERLWSRITRRPNSPSGQEAQIARVVMNMVNSLLNLNVDVRLPHAHMNELIEKCKGLIAHMVVEFSSKFEPEASELSRQLTGIKDRLESR